MNRSLALLCPALLCIALPLALAACKGEEKPAQDARAAGEILPGSASDAMIPLDTVRSQAPLAPPPTASAKSGKAGETKAADDGEAEEAEAPAEPAAEAPEPTPTAE